MSTSNGTSSRPVDRVLAELAARLETDMFVMPTWDGTGRSVTSKLEAERATAQLHEALTTDGPSWRHYLRAASTRVIASEDPDQARKHLMTVLRVCSAWVADIDSREDR